MTMGIYLSGWTFWLMMYCHLLGCLINCSFFLGMCNNFVKLQANRVTMGKQVFLLKERYVSRYFPQALQSSGMVVQQGNYTETHGLESSMDLLMVWTYALDFGWVYHSVEGQMEAGLWKEA